MRPIKDMKDQQLNVALAELTCFPVDKLTPNYCNDPAASLEVQAKAIETSFELYFINLAEIIATPIMKMDSYGILDLSSFIEGRIKLDVVAELVLASPRQRAEAAYMTLKEVMSHDQDR